MGNMKAILLGFLLCFPNAAECNTLFDPLYTYCPSVTNCGMINTTIISDQPQQACCGTCSCDKNCGQNQSCCLQDENEAYTKAMGRECIELYFGDTNMFYASSGYAVMMVTRCADEQAECKYENGALNVSPVSTPSETFLNENCAICNNVRDFKHWPSDLKLSTGGFQTDVWYDSEKVTQLFRPPKGTKQTSCIATQIEASQRCSNDNYTQLCQLLKLPFTLRTYTYNNIYCYFCKH